MLTYFVSLRGSEHYRHMNFFSVVVIIVLEITMNINSSLLSKEIGFSGATLDIGERACRVGRHPSLSLTAPCVSLMPPGS